MCLSGPAAEELFCGPITDDGDRVDYEMARHHLADRFDRLRVEAEITRRAAARRLVRTRGRGSALSFSPTRCCGSALYKRQASVHSVARDRAPK